MQIRNGKILKQMTKEDIIMKFRKKPIVIEAYQTFEEKVIPTLEGDMKASIGDYIITGIRGEQYPCKPDIFRKTYDPIKDNNDGRTTLCKKNMEW